MVNYTDQLLTCAGCGQTFVFTAGDQAFYAERGFSAPRRCKACRDAAKASRGGGMPRRDDGGMRGGGTRQLYDAVCAGCGAPTQVPFKPTGVKPVYCRNCFRN